MKITSLKNEWLKDILKLKQKKYRDQSDVFLIEGKHLVEEARASGLLDKTLGLSSSCDIEINEMIAQRLSETVSGSEIFALVKKPVWENIRQHRILICEDIQDPGNLGTMIRSAYSFGFDAVYTSPNSVDILNDKVLRSSQGALFHLPVIACDLKELIENLKQKGLSVYATHLHKDSISLKSLDKSMDIAVILGSEGKGVSDDLLALADQNLRIPTVHFESLNVAIAASIIAYELKDGEDNEAH